MNFRLLSQITLVILILVGCTSKSTPEKKVLSSSYTLDSISAQKKVYVDDDTLKQAMTLNLFLEYPKTLADSTNCSKIQSLIGLIFLGKDSVNVFNEILPKQAFSLLEKRYINEAHKYAEEWSLDEEPYVDFSEYYQDISTRIDAIIGSIMVVSTTRSSYLGGAHGGYYVLYDNIDIKTAQIITEKELFIAGSEDEIASAIQRVISLRNESQNKDDRINLLLDLEDVKSNSNFYFSNEGLVYVYNEYDITSYADGIQEVVVPYTDIIDLINDKYIPLINSIRTN